MGNTFGSLFRITTWGESHGAGVGVVIDGCPPRLELTEADLQADLDRRRPGQSRITTQRSEEDRAEILSGVFDGQTTGSPIAVLVRNSDARSDAYDHLRDLYRPSHADYTYEAKYGIRDWRGGGRASARETVGRVAAGAIARKLLSHVAGIEVLAWVSQVHTITTEIDPVKVTLEEVESDPTRCPDPDAAAAIGFAIEEARRDGDSLGGVVTCVARGVPPGLGDPVFDRLEADLAKGMLSLPASRGFEVGSGFGSVVMTGREHNDPFIPGDSGPTTSSNRSGGVQGGISNGSDVLFRVPFKPTATIASPQDTVDTSNVPVVLEARGRHDPCVLPRAVPLVEAMALLTLADHWLRQRAVDLP
ncbi:MAG: chorismate synthase [Acidimicrobiia bacterium]|nr:chorismate synthase [Actinomycetota bacterium]MBL6923770.1 chorismate synthase [Acidimicrobiia bacterium]MBL6926990.1 chorismate synthase [Acidimicrobiia bacterium]